MNFLKHSSRAIAAYHQLHSSSRYPFLILPINRSSLYSTSYQLNAAQITKLPRTRKPREPSTSSSPSSPLIDQAAGVFDWPPPPPDEIPYQAKDAKIPQTRKTREPKSSSSSPSFTPPRPDEIPYQAKDANVVNLIGHIKLPFMSYTFLGGKYRAITFISQEFGGNVFSIPIVFEDDLARVVSFHLKEGDSVHVNGQLSEDPIPFDLSVKRSNYHVLVQDIKFVTGFHKKPIEGDIFPDNGVPAPARNDAFNHFGDNHFGISAAQVDQEWDSPKSSPTLNDGESEECIIDTPKRFHTKKAGHSDWDSWQDLVENSKQWLDFREKKSEGSLTPKFPDFKHKDAGTSLWITKAPKSVLTMLGNLEFGVNAPKQNFGSKNFGSKNFGSKHVVSKNSKDEVWKSLVENPSLWWDNRLDKKNVKAPDFVHKETREALWLNRSTDWVVSKLPPPSQC